MYGSRKWRGFVLAAAIFLPVTAEARSPLDLEDDSIELLNLVEQLDPATLRQGTGALGDRGFREAMAEGEVAYIMGDYEGAATILSALVEGSSAFLEAGYARSLFLLGDSLQRMGDEGLARVYYDRLFTADDGEYGLHGGLRLVEIALAYRDYDGAVEAYESVQARYGDVATGAMAYVRGKIDYDSGAVEAALPRFQSVPENDQYHGRAQYYLGAGLVRLGRLDEAELQFEQVIALIRDMEVVSPEDATVLELSRLAVARIAYERENWDEAVISYSSVSPDASEFDAALYEMSWTLLREERHEDAALNLAVLSEMSLNTNFVAEAQLLAGESFRKAENYERAEDFYRQTGEDFAQAWRRMDSLLQADLSVTQIYSRVTEIEVGSRDAELRVEDWVSEDPSVTRALHYVRDSARVHRWLRESEVVLNDVERRLTASEEGAVYPEAARLRSSIASGWRESVKLRAEALDEDYAIMRGSLTEAQRLDLASVQADRRRRYDEFMETELIIPVTEPSEASERNVELNEMITELSAAEADLERELRGLDELNDQLRLNLEMGTVDPIEASRMAGELGQARVDLRSNLEQIRNQRQQLLAIRGDAATNDDGGASMAALRRLLNVMETEQAILGQLITNRADVDTLDGVIDRLNVVDDQLVSLQAALGREVARRRSVYMDMVNLERRRTQAMAATLDSYDAQGSGVTDRVARESMEAMHEKIADVVLRANLGTVDVSWWQKESLREQIEELQLNLRREITTLDADFAEILGE